MKKFILLISLLFILTGCDSSYSININKDMTINETLNIKIYKNEINKYNTKGINNIDYLQSLVDEYKDFQSYDKYMINIQEYDKYYEMKFERIYADYTEFNEKNLIPYRMFEDYSITLENNKLSLNTGNYQGVGYFENFTKDNITFNVSSYYQFINNNSDSFDLGENKSTFTFNKSVKDKRIKYILNTSNIYNKTSLTTLTFLLSINLWIIFVLLFIILIIFATLYMIKRHKNMSI